MVSTHEQQTCTVPCYHPNKLNQENHCLCLFSWLVGLNKKHGLSTRATARRPARLWEHRPARFQRNRGRSSKIWPFQQILEFQIGLPEFSTSLSIFRHPIYKIETWLTNMHHNFKDLIQQKSAMQKKPSACSRSTPIRESLPPDMMTMATRSWPTDFKGRNWWANFRKRWKTISSLEELISRNSMIVNDL